MKNFFTKLPIAFLALCLSTASAIGQDLAPFPVRPIKIIVLGAPGGLSDLYARLVGDRLATALGQPVIMDYRPGAGGIIATQLLMSAPADGYTLMLGYSGLTQNLAFRSDKLYTLKDFAPISQVTFTHTGFFVSASLGVTTLAQFAALVKASPKKYSYGTFGIASTGHIAAEMLSKTAGLEMIHVPYKGETPGLNDLLGGQISAFPGGGLGSFMPHVKSGRLRVLAVAGDKRAAVAADAPTFAEAGFPEAGFTTWAGFLAPAQTPKAIVLKLSEEISRIVKLPEVSAKIEEYGASPVGSTSDAFANFIDADLKRWILVANTTGIKLN